MSKTEQYVCDGCGKIVGGYDRLRRVALPHLSLSGKIALQHVDPDTGWRSHVFITRPPAEDLTFCLGNEGEIDLCCLREYIMQKDQSYQVRRRENLREETSNALVRGPEKEETFAQPFDIRKLKL